MILWEAEEHSSLHMGGRRRLDIWETGRGVRICRGPGAARHGDPESGSDRLTGFKNLGGIFSLPIFPVKRGYWASEERVPVRCAPVSLGRREPRDVRGDRSVVWIPRRVASLRHGWLGPYARSATVSHMSRGIRGQLICYSDDTCRRVLRATLTLSSCGNRGRVA